jgi:hypothetical protein
MQGPPQLARARARQGPDLAVLPMVLRLLLLPAAAAAAAASSRSAAVVGPCDPGRPAPLPGFCNTSMPVQMRVRELLGELTLAEQISLMGSDGAAVPRLGIPQLRWGTECLHGVVKNDYVDPPGTPPLNGPGDGKGATVFPQPLCTAASFSRGLLGRIGEAIGTEARALNNVGMAAGTADATSFLSCWAPNINIYRDARWGRGSASLPDRQAQAHTPCPALRPAAIDPRQLSVSLLPRASPRLSALTRSGAAACPLQVKLTAKNRR